MQIGVAEQITVPAEWTQQKAIWTAWPADPDQWDDDLATPRTEVAALVRALSPSNRVRLLVAGAEAEASARAALGNAAEIVPARYGDIWLRDTGPITLVGDGGPACLLDFRFTGWGGKFGAGEDDQLVERLSRMGLFFNTSTQRIDFALEGGAIDTDGHGTLLSTWRPMVSGSLSG